MHSTSSAAPSSRSQLKRRICHIRVLSPSLDGDGDNTGKEQTQTQNKLNFVQWNLPSSSSTTAATTVELTRPHTNITKKYNVDGIFTSSSSSSSSLEYFQSHIQPCVKESLVNNSNLLLWSFGTRQTGKTRVLFGSSKSENDAVDGWIGQIASNINQYLLSSSDYSNDTTTTTTTATTIEKKENVIVTLSSICVTADDTDRAFDCLASPSSSPNKPLSRIREDPSHGFYLENETQVVVTNLSEIQKVLQTSYQNENLLELGSRVHRLLTFTIRKLYRNGDVVSFTLQVMDVCGAERPDSSGSSNTGGGSKTGAAARTKVGGRKTTTAVRQQRPMRQQQRKKEDKTLRAISRVIDGLSNGDKHIPYRDSKLTRLAFCRGFGGCNDSTINVALICVSAVDESMYDETCAMMEFANKICSWNEQKNESVSYSSSEAARTNRLNNLKEAEQMVVELSKKCGFDTAKGVTEKRLLSSDIELDMSSSMDLVELRDALVKVESLEVDPIQSIVDKSNQWWEDLIQLQHEKE